MDYEYVAVSWQTARRVMDKAYHADYQRLCEAGWETWQWAYFEQGRVGGACIMRRPKDEPRMWTKGEIEEISLAYHNLQLERLTMEVNAKTEKEIQDIARDVSGSALNERAMQADLIGCLERRNVELQTAIDEVVGISRGRCGLANTIPPFPGVFRAVYRLLYPLATKEETNG